MVNTNCPFSRTLIPRPRAEGAFISYFGPHSEARHPLKGDTAKAKVDYRDFLTLWKDANPNGEDRNAGKAQQEKIEIVWNNFGDLKKIDFPMTPRDG